MSKRLDLDSLKLALDTNNHNAYHGDWGSVLQDVVDELMEWRNETGYDDPTDAGTHLKGLIEEKDEFNTRVLDAGSLYKCRKTKHGFSLTSEDKTAKLSLTGDWPIKPKEEYEIILAKKG